VTLLGPELKPVAVAWVPFELHATDSIPIAMATTPIVNGGQWRAPACVQVEMRLTEG
jgi:hypothetical protein